MCLSLLFGLAGYLCDKSSLYGNIFWQLAISFVSFMHLFDSKFFVMLRRQTASSTFKISKKYFKNSPKPLT